MAELINFDDYVRTLPVDPSHDAEALLLTCIDFRFFKKIAEKMEGIKYDHVILAGAALGTNWPRREYWHTMFFDHLYLARELHNITRVIVMEHRECGAYGPKGLGLLPDKPDPEDERRVHMEQVAKLRPLIPMTLGFSCFLLDVPPTEDSMTFDKLI